MPLKLLRRSGVEHVRVELPLRLPKLFGAKRLLCLFYYVTTKGPGSGKMS